MLENKWKHGKVHFELSQLSPVLIASPGIKPISMILDNNIGEEIVLLITEPKELAKDFEGRDITRFMLKVGLIKTSYGPICFLLFYFPDPLTGGQITYESTINIDDYEHISIYKQLSIQRYWHVIIADDTGEVVNFLEFPNEYGLIQTFNQIEDACKNMKVINYTAAKYEYEQKYSIEQLLEM